MHLSGFVNTNYLFNLTEEEADEEQQKLYRLKHIIFQFKQNHGNMYCAQTTY